MATWATARPPRPTASTTSRATPSSSISPTSFPSGRTSIPSSRSRTTRREDPHTPTCSRSILAATSGWAGSSTCPSRCSWAKRCPRKRLRQPCPAPSIRRRASPCSAPTSRPATGPPRGWWPSSNWAATGRDHRDKFELIYFGFGRLLYPDWNAPKQYEPMEFGWTRNAWARRALVVERVDPQGGNPPTAPFQRRCEVPRHHHPRDLHRRGAARANVLLTGGSTCWRLALADSPRRTYDWFVHALGRLSLPEPDAFQPQPGPAAAVSLGRSPAQMGDRSHVVRRLRAANGRGAPRHGAVQRRVVPYQGRRPHDDARPAGHGGLCGRGAVQSRAQSPRARQSRGHDPAGDGSPQGAHHVLRGPARAFRQAAVARHPAGRSAARGHRRLRRGDRLHRLRVRFLFRRAGRNARRCGGCVPVVLVRRLRLPSCEAGKVIAREARGDRSASPRRKPPPRGPSCSTAARRPIGSSAVTSCSTIRRSRRRHEPAAANGGSRPSRCPRKFTFPAPRDDEETERPSALPDVGRALRATRYTSTASSASRERGSTATGNCCSAASGGAARAFSRCDCLAAHEETAPPLAAEQQLPVAVDPRSRDAELAVDVSDRRPDSASLP